MRTLEELIDTADPAWPLVRQWVADAEVSCEHLQASDERAQVLHALQVTTRSPLGALAYETGGLMVAHGWLRILGSGHPRLPRNLRDWNAGRSTGFLLVADDAVGGFFAINGGALGPDLGKLYYWAPDSLDWQGLALGFTEFLQVFLSRRMDDFYADLRWDGWKSDLASLADDRCFSFYPFLWTREGAIQTSSRSAVPVSEAYDMKMDIVQQARHGV
jgi:hypothetical protein